MEKLEERELKWLWKFYKTALRGAVRPDRNKPDPGGDRIVRDAIDQKAFAKQIEIIICKNYGRDFSGPVNHNKSYNKGNQQPQGNNQVTGVVQTKGGATW